MTREELQAQLTQILEQDFEFSNVAPGDNLRDVHGFDSIDAIELLAKLEKPSVSSCIISFTYSSPVAL